MANGTTKKVNSPKLLPKIRYIDLMVALLADLSADELTTRYILKRVEVEGIAFLTVPLPAFEKSVLSYIESGSDLYSGISYKHARWHSLRTQHNIKYDLFEGQNLYPFGCFLEPIKSGLKELNLHKVANNLFKLRQICSYLYKLVGAPSLVTETEAVADWLAIEIAMDRTAISSNRIASMRTLIFKEFSLLTTLHEHSLLSSYPPRNTSGSFMGYNRLINDSPSATREMKSPYYEYTHFADNNYKGTSGYKKPYKSYKFRYQRCESTSPITNDKLLYVPKNRKTPRGIMKTDPHMLSYQMSFFDFMVDYLEKVTSKRINFRDQSVNQKLAYQGSIDGSYCTFDLSSASDRVSFSLISRLFQGTPLLKFISKYRNYEVKLPLVKEDILYSNLRKRLTPSDFTELCNKVSGTAETGMFYGPLKKLAGMGSGFTFPLLAFVCYLSIVSYLVDHGVPFKVASRDVYVYGDDIIVKSYIKHIVPVVLSEIGLKINPDKSFTNSYFRESCGVDAYGGYNVTPVRLKLAGNCDGDGNANDLKKHSKSYKIQNDLGFLELERHCRELIRKGLRRTAEYYYNILEFWYGKLPYGSRQTPHLVRYIEESAVTDIILDAFFLNNKQNFIRYYTPVAVTSKYDLDENGESLHDPYKYMAKKSYNEFESGVLDYGEYTSPNQIKIRGNYMRLSRKDRYLDSIISFYGWENNIYIAPNCRDRV